jgi:hypothetical protein
LGLSWVYFVYELMSLIVRGYKYKASRLLGLSLLAFTALSPGGWHLEFCHYCCSTIINTTTTSTSIPSLISPITPALYLLCSNLVSEPRSQPMKTRSSAMAEDSQQLAQLQGQVTSLQAEMATRAEIQNTREAVDRLTQMVQLLMDDRPRNPKKQPILNTETLSNTDSPNNHIHHHLDPNNHTHPHIPNPHVRNPPPPTNLGGETHSSPESSYSGEGLKPKTVRLEFPCFDGEDPETWCCRAEQFFEMYCTPDTQRLSICAFHMDGKALVWFQELKASNAISSRTDFTRAIQIRFGRGPYDNPMETLSKLCQVGSLEDYKNQFDILALKVHRLPDEHKLSCFLGGLKDEIRLPVRMFNPKYLVDAYSLARIQEECLSSLVRGVRPPWRSTPFNHSPRSMSLELPLGNGKGIFPWATSMG